MNSILKTTAIVAIVLLGPMRISDAVPVTVTFTADDNTAGGLCADMTCLSVTQWSDLGNTSYLDWWPESDSVTIDLSLGTHYFIWFVENKEIGAVSNPASLLAEIRWDGNIHRSGPDWEVSAEFPNPTSWIAATEYGVNGGNNIWTDVASRPIPGISSEARWIWTDLNFIGGMDDFAALRTRIAIAEVPQPGLLATLGAAFLTLAIAKIRTATGSPPA